MQADTAPLITAVVATYNEERHIAECLAGLRSQVDLPGSLEILVVDGGSTDHTVEIVRALAAGDARIRLLDNPGRYQVFAWNIGTREARGHFVAFCSAHTDYASDYLARCYDAQRRTGAANVGGVQTPVGDGLIGKSIALAMQSPFGVGNAHFRYSSDERFVDTVFGDFFERRVLLDLGGYDETVVFNEDSELNYRLRQAGYRILLSPTIRVNYHVRESIPALMRQMFRYGFWRRRTQLEHPRFVPWRIMAPPLLVLGLVFSLIGAVLLRSWWWLALPAIYTLFTVVAALVIGMQRRTLLPALCLLFVLPAMHIAYGLGWWNGFFVHRKRGVRGSLSRARAAS
ncbi:MAG: glycosyltransferase [Candidatus Eremiobacteraeota bacterium]|nr:glycosyltransferase [Candidatus Eremiobacteraeota bacterium]MBV8367145.1 glycosyltransferase [Candidatus Eremiobacteraeota bacterium]